MDLNAARDLAENMLVDHGLKASGWSFAWDNAEKRLGLCSYTNRRITMSRKMTEAADEEIVVQTMIHEVAHALVGPSNGHGSVWRAKAASLGYKGERTARNPHSEAKDRALLPSHLRDIQADGTLNAGDRGILLGGGPKYVGMLVTITKRNPKTYGLRTDAGQRLNSSKLFVGKAPADAVPAPPAPAPEHPLRLLKAGECGVITTGKYRGTRLTVRQVNRSRYSAEAEGLGRLNVPFSMVSTQGA